MLPDCIYLLSSFFWVFFAYFVDCILESFVQWRRHNTPTFQVSRVTDTHGNWQLANKANSVATNQLGRHRHRQRDPPLSCLQFSACGFVAATLLLRFILFSSRSCWLLFCFLLLFVSRLNATPQGAAESQRVQVSCCRMHPNQAKPRNRSQRDLFKCACMFQLSQLSPPPPTAH